MTAIFSTDRNFNIYDDEIPQSLRRHAMDALVLEIQDLVQTFFKEYEVHGREHLYYMYFFKLKDRIDNKITDILSYNGASESYHKKIINKKIDEYKSKMDTVKVELSRSEIIHNPAIDTRAMNLSSRFSVRLRIISTNP